MACSRTIGGDRVITLYHAPMSRSLRVRWLLEELAIPYQLETRKLAELKTPEYLALHPLGKVPSIRDGELVLFESGAIVQYLLETHGDGRLEPKLGSPERPKFLQWLHFAEASMAPPLGLIVQNTLIRPEAERISAIVPDAIKGAGNALAVAERALAGRDWLLGEFSAADVMMGYSVLLANFVKLVTDATPNLRAYLARCQERPAFRKATAA
jgi:glutathione S-transferase